MSVDSDTANLANYDALFTSCYCTYGGQFMSCYSSWIFTEDCYSDLDNYYNTGE